LRENNNMYMYDFHCHIVASLKLPTTAYISHKKRDVQNGFFFHVMLTVESL